MMIEDSRIAFIGAGNMARGLIGGLVANGMKPERLAAADPNEAARRALADQSGIDTSADNAAVIAPADVVVFAVKPQLMAAVVRAARPALKGRDKLIISIAGGIRLAAIQRWLAFPARTVRAMPNTPALLRAGATALFAGPQAGPQQRAIAEALLSSVGAVVWLEDEAQMDAVTALSGSGPAYFFYLMEAMEKTARDMGLNADQARLLTLETALGAAKMARASSADPKTLREQVTSRGGTTEQALNLFNECGLADVIGQAMRSASARSEALAEEFGK